MIKTPENEAMDSYRAIQIGLPEDTKTADLHNTILIKKTVENRWLSPEGLVPRAFRAYGSLHQPGCYNIITSENQSPLCVNSKGGEGMTCMEIEEEDKESDKRIRKPICGDTTSAQAVNRSWIFLLVKEYSGAEDTVSFVADLFKIYWDKTKKEPPVPMWRHLFPYGKNNDEELKEVGKSTGKVGEVLAELVIVFNLWQFIKHSNLHVANERLRFFGFLDGSGRPDGKENRPSG